MKVGYIDQGYGSIWSGFRLTWKDMAWADNYAPAMLKLSNTHLIGVTPTENDH